MKYAKPKVNRASVVKVYEWCKKKYGRSKYKRSYPEICFKKEDCTTEGLYGYYDYDDNEIYVNSTLIQELEDLVTTVIHEYVHYKQSKLDFFVLSRYFDSSSLDHPLEREAEEVSQRDKSECMKEVFGIN